MTASPATLRTEAGGAWAGGTAWVGGKGLLSTLCLASALGLLHYLLHSAAADIPTSSALSALAWPAPAIGIALLWSRPAHEWPYFLLAIGGALFMVGQLDWLHWSIDLLFAFLGLLAVGLGAAVALRWVGASAVPNTTRSWLRFVLLLPGAMAAFNAVLIATALWWAVDAPWLPLAGRIYAAQALAFLTVLPALLSVSEHGQGDSRNTLVISVAASASLALGLLPDMPEEAIRALLALTLAGAAFRMTPASVARLSALIAVALVVLTLLGLGPYVERNGVDVWALQLDLVGLSLLSLGMAIALHERRRLAAQLEQTRRIEALGFLAGGIAHDFNNLLGTIGACAELAADQWPAVQPPAAPRPAPQSLQLLETEVQRGREMTQELMLAARQGDPQRSAVPVADLLADVVDAARALCPAHVRIELAELPAPQICAKANASQLRRAVQNLVRNAAQAARSQVWVRAGVAQPSQQDTLPFDAAVGELAPGPAIWIEVADDGAGIDAAHWPHLFDPFYSTRRGSGGTGLGLAIVAGVACSHEGRVSMQTQLGQGTRFWLSLPQVNPTR